MKILHMISGGDSGGAKTHVFALLDRLRHLADVKIICFTEGVFYTEIIKTDIPCQLLLQKNRSDMSVVPILAKMINDEGYQIIHAHGARANFIANSLKKHVDCPVVTTVHSDYMLDFDQLYKKIAFTLLNMHSLRQLDYYIAVSDTFKKMLIDRNYNPNKIFTVYNGMDYDKPIEYRSKEDFAKRFGIIYDPQKIYIGIIGRMDKVKGHEVFVKAASIAAKNDSRLEFLIAGDGPEQKNLARLAREGGIEEKLHFLGFIKDIYSFINFIDINTLTSHSESFPYVLLEGARLKKPTVSSNVGGIADLLIDGETGFTFSPGDDKALSEHLLYLAARPDERTRLGNALYDHATTRFSSDALARRHIEIYEAILSDRASEYKYDAVLSGYYGFKNSGDDALLYAISENKERMRRHARLAVLSGDAKSTARDYGVDAIDRYNIFKIISTMKKSKLLISGGGSLIQDRTSNKSLYYYLFIIYLAKRLGLSVMIYANGIGPITHQKNERLVKRVLDNVDVITLRDEDSKAELMRIGVENDNIHVTADPALTLCPASDSAAKRLLELSGVKGDYVVISVRTWQTADTDFETVIAQAADYIQEKYGILPLFSPMQYPSDSEQALRILKLMKTKGYILPQCAVKEQIAVIKRSAGVIGMRLHTLIYAISTGVPTIAIAYDPKVRGFMNYMGRPLMVDIESVNATKLFACIDTLMMERDTLCDQAKDTAEKLLSLAKKNIDYAHELMKEPGDMPQK